MQFRFEGEFNFGSCAIGKPRRYGTLANQTGGAQFGVLEGATLYSVGHHWPSVGVRRHVNCPLCL